MEGSESEEVKSVKRGSPECLQVKRKRVDKKKKKKKKKQQHGASRLQRCTDASSKGEIAGGSEHRQVKRKRFKHKRLHVDGDDGSSWLVDYRKRRALEHAKMALEFYEKSQDDAEFEILEVLNISDSRLGHPESVNP